MSWAGVNNHIMHPTQYTSTPGFVFACVSMHHIYYVSASGISSRQRKSALMSVFAGDIAYMPPDEEVVHAPLTSDQRVVTRSGRRVVFERGVELLLVLA